MANITLRSGKGSPLTHDEVDDNFTNINDELSDYLPLAGGTLSGKTTFSDSARFDGIIDAHSNISLQSGIGVSWDGSGDGVEIRGTNSSSGESLRFTVGDAIPATFESNEVTFNVVDVQINSKLSHNGDANTFLQFSPDTLGITTGGTQRVEITNTGLDVTGAITVGGNVDGRDVAADGTKLDGIDSDADVTDTVNVVAALTAGTNITIGNDGTISSTDTTYSVGDGGLTQKNFTTTLNDKLGDIEELADVTDTVNVVAALTAGTNITIGNDGTISSAAAYTDADVDAYINASINTGDISEGSNLYYTNARADARVNSGFSNKSTSDLDEGTNKYYTDARVDTYINASINTGDISEGSNLYYTDLRARGAFSAGSNVTITAGGEISSTDTTYSVGDGGLTQKNFTTTLNDKLDGIEEDADVTDTDNVVAALTAGTNVAIASNGTISSTDTTYSVGDGGLTQKNFTTTLNDKLDDAVISDNAENSATTQVGHIQVLTAAEYFTLVFTSTTVSDTLYLVSE